MPASGGSLSGSSSQRMASAITQNFIDDDQFDWEAAVREVDHACQATDPSPPRPVDPLHQVPATNPLVHSDSGNSHRKSSASRQSTLDKFIGKAGNNYPSENQGKFEGGGAVSCIKIDPEVAKTWIYPVNVPLRDYQLSITRTALFSNTLVALPTGLGKTLIAAVVMYNYFRWFPEGKIVFAAPSRPLVMQQIEACHNIVGIPQEWTIDMTGQTTPSRRACFWKAKRVFFVTPQVLEKDIQSGICLVEDLVCLVIDEAHRALGNYSYCVAVRELMAVHVQLRILALTATPGSKQQTIQHIIDNLQISTLEYRSESDHDVRPYVHDRKIELLEVAMGRDAVEINKLLLEVIRPFVARLCAIGVLQNRDFQTLSPCDLLNSRDKFRQAPPLDLPTVKHGEVEGYFGVLITLYHIRKLLTSHGIRPAYEMLEEKLQQGSFARLMSRNEVLCKAKHLMQKSLSHGAPNPKLSKMLEVLIDHFKMKDPKNSRVIIFSNFRGSVRDIMDALANISELVKATQFVGQSSGKTLKGQSQKVQQSVLEKFRSGGYNVIVATSIGEEGLDIMEVDLVICFDANISPLRMIQRMGRTGRKHDGRVVVLACEGSELKGYMRKQASSNTVKKHMRNGGMNSFNFHSSPRMIPHIFKPEAQFLELSIERFIPRGRKVKDDHPIETTIFKAKLTDAETDLLAKYFHPAKKCTWRPSLLAFPHFQAFPSRVQKVMHSFRTSMLIDAMQCLQGLSYTRDGKTLFAEDESLSNVGLGVEIVDQFEKGTKDVQQSHGFPGEHLHLKVTDSDPLLMETMATEKYYLPDSCVQNTPMHSYLFGSNFISVDSSGNILVLSVPLLPLTDQLHSKCVSGSNAILLNYSEQDCSNSKASQGGYKEMSSRVKEMSNQMASLQTRCEEENENKLDGAETSLQTRVSKISLSNEGENSIKAPNENCTVELLADNSINELRDAELSPRLTNFINSGVVPESPIDCAGIPKGKSGGRLTVPFLGPPAKSSTQVFLESPIPEKKEEPIMNNGAGGRDVSASVVVETHTLILDAEYSAVKAMVSAFPVFKEAQTPLVNSKSNSCSEDWCLNSGGESATFQQEKKYKRLRKYGDHSKSRPPEGTEENVCQKTKSASAHPRSDPVYVKNDKGKRKPVNDVRAFIEEEAEVSSEVEVSGDEEEEQDNDSCDNSFIDDRINPTAANTQAENSRSDMMAIYRRSLLSQSPIKRLSYCQEFSPDSVSPQTRAGESGSLAGTVNDYFPTHQTGLEFSERNSPFFQLEPQRISSEAMPSTTNGNPIENENKICSRKRKLSFPQVRSVPAIGLDQEFRQQDQGQQVKASGDAFDDDQFYEGLDLDAVEEQAAKLLGYNLEVSAPKRVMILDPRTPQLDIVGSPSFDLGI